MAGTKLSVAERRAIWRERSAKWRADHRESDRAHSAAYAKANPEKRLAAARRRRAAQIERDAPARAALRVARHEAAKERARLAAKAYRSEHRDEILARGKAWRAAHPGRMRELIRAWKARNPEKVRASKQRHTKSIRAALAPLQRGRCAYCRGKLVAGSIHIDQTQPRTAGGSNARSNLQLTCVGCNLMKNARDPIDFAQSKGLLL